MALTHIPLDQITEAHLKALIEAGAPETLHIEYKRETYGSNDESRREFLADLSSFANARGGDLLIGVAAENGIPAALAPFQGNADTEVWRLDNMARTGMEPRVHLGFSAAFGLYLAIHGFVVSDRRRVPSRRTTKFRDSDRGVRSK